MLNTFFRTLALALLFVAGVAMLSSCKGSDDYDLYSSIEGYVYDTTTASPVENASITLSPLGKSTMTAVDGTFSFSDLDARQYTLLVQKSGYQPNRKVINVVAGERNEVNVSLTKISDL